MAKEEFNYIDIFESRQWERVLFLTYALSLTFFETVILRKLRNVGCQDIWIVADIDGYQMSLSERKSTHIGQEYRLVPVGLSKGVFHPKCVYLSSADGDLLIVGSGNLTFGGYGRNLEVAEILTPEKAPSAFLDFSNFLEELKDRKDFKSPETKWISDFIVISRNAVKNNTNLSDNQPRIISSVKKKIADRVIDSCKGMGKPEKIVSLSPFYSDDLDGIKYIFDKTGCKSIMISLPPGNPKESAFPYKKAHSMKLKIESVVPVVYKNSKKYLIEGKRKLHAKWIELHAGKKGKITIIGSINSTNQALITTNNIELGIIRYENDVKKWILWEPAKLPSTNVIKEYSKPGIGERIIVYANISEDGLLEGVIIWNDDTEGSWDGLIVKSDGTNVIFTVQVDGVGRFKLRVPDLEEFAFSSALQICLSRGKNYGRGWIHLENILQIPRTKRLSLTSILRMINREETQDDEIALIDYLAMSEARHLSVFAEALKTRILSKKEQSDNEENFILQVDLLKPDPDAGQSNNQYAERAYGQRNSLERILLQLRRRLLGHNSTKSKKQPVYCFDGFNDDDEEFEKGSKDSNRDRLRLNVDDFNNAMYDILETSESAHIKAAVLSMSLEVSMHMYQHRFYDREEALFFIKQWFQIACNHLQVCAEVNSAEQHIYAAAAILSGLMDNSDNDENNIVTDKFNRSMLHKLLEKYYTGNVNKERTLSTLTDFNEASYITWLADKDGNSIIDYLSKVLGEKTIRYMVIEIIEKMKKNLPLPPMHPDCSDSLKKFYNLQSHGKKIIYKEQCQESLSCPHCNIELSDCASGDLMQGHLAYCDNCGKIIIRTKP